MFKQFSQKNFTNGPKEGQISIQNKDWTTKASTLVMVNSVNAVIWADKSFIKDIIEQLGISVSTTHKIVRDDLDFSKVSGCWVSLRQCKASYCCENNGNH